MKHGLLKYRTSNLGDEIQSLAAKQFLPKVDVLLNRDTLSYQGWRGPTAVIMNGWFLHRRYGGLHMQSNVERWIHDRILTRINGCGYDWPPPSNLRPLLVSHHFQNSGLMNSDVVDFYRRNAPVGCRDQSTLDLMQAHGVDSYFSGCLTLTLRPTGIQKTEKIVFVDPFAWDHQYRFPLPHDKHFRKDLWERFPEIVRKNALFVTQAYYGSNPGVRQRKAKALLNIYESAKLVITSRIHCALPCLALGTPVVFLRRDEADSRFDRLIDLFDTRYTFSEILSGQLDVDWETPKPGSKNFRPLATKLYERCSSFICDTNN